ncbi:transcriptional regulatory protein QseB [mine drainage metagenome]|uniref:Transcriptional regulatory protein QseB n=1 Tax=mine drainage metagenome TaxID=410659 RepID=A0A1J5QTT8_9ZZZZ
MRLLVVEDDPMIGRSVREGLRQDGYSVDLVQDGIAAAMALDSEVYDLMLLDLGLPRKSGLEVLAELRRHKNPIPVLILTARDSVADRIAGLDAGADDYLVKPFSLDELAARIRALLRRKSGHLEPVIEHGRLTINAATREVTLDGQPVALSAREFSLLNTLMQQAGAPLSRAQLEESLYGWDEEIESNAVEVYIHALRRKLGAAMIRNVRGVGYFIPKAS